MSRLDPGTAQVKTRVKTSNHIERYDYKCETRTISNDVVTKSVATMWLSQVNQVTISDDVITKDVST